MRSSRLSGLEASFSPVDAASNPSRRFRGLLLAIAIVIGASPALQAQAPSVSATSLTVTSGGSAITSVNSGAVVALTASVMAGASPVTTGRVSFCDATASDCIGLHQLAGVQLNGAGVAVYRFRPGPGSRRFKAVFIGTNTVATSASSPASLTVIAPTAPALATTTTIASSGSWGSYTLGATVTEIGSATAPTGTISFVDTNNSNAILGSAALGTGIPGTGFLNATVNLPGVRPDAIGVGDFNEDGIIDLAVSQNGSNSVALLMGNADGTFTKAAVSPATGLNPFTVIVDDFNRDGHQDLAIENAGDGTISILLGNGDGTFNAGPHIAANQTLVAMVAGDFNGDGQTDLVLANSQIGTFSIYFGNGDGTFSLGSTTPLVSAASSILAADFNGDGKVDLVVGNYGSTVLLLGKGDGTFTPSTAPGLPANAASMLAGDFNGDGKLDLAVGITNNTTGTNSPVAIFLGNGDGSFNAVPGNGTSSSLMGMAMADLNQDGIPDLIIPAYSSYGATLLIGRGDGTFSVSAAPAPAQDSTNVLTVADFNGDGIPDIAMASSFYSTIAVNITKPTVTATTPPVTLLPGAPGAHLVAASYPGNALYQPSASATVRLWGQPPATITTLAVTAAGSAVTTTPANTVVTLTATVAAGGSPLPSGQVNFCDAAAPGCTDIHFVGSAQLTSSGTAVLRFVPGSGTHQYKAVFQQSSIGVTSSSASSTLVVQVAPPVPVSTATAIAPNGTVGDYILTATVTSAGGSMPMTGAISFEDTSSSNAVLATAQLGSGTVGLAWIPTFAVPHPNPYFLKFSGGDFNGDGFADFAAVDQNRMTVDIYLGNGDGTFKTAAPLTLTTDASGVVAADYNGDGILDLAVSSVSADYLEIGSLTIYLGNGDGTFTPVSAHPTVGNYVQVFSAADINGDGKLDLVINENTATRILFGNGDGTFSQGPANGIPAALAVADLNGDGMPDIVSGNSSSVATVYLGNGDGTFHPSATLAGAPFLAVAAVGDFNGDGIPDLEINSQYYSTATIFLGKGNGTFTPVANASRPTINEPLASAVGDFNHDGKLDVVLSNYNGGQLTLLLGNGDGTITPGSIDTQFSYTAAMLPIDVNGDGTPDLIVDSGNGLTVVIPRPTQTSIARVSGIAVSGPGTHAVDAVYSGDTNYLTSTSTTTPLLAQVAAPTFSLAPGTFTSTQTVTLADATPGATIFYSLDGPNVSSSFGPYTGPLTLSYGGTYTLQAYATATGYQQSAVSVATYVLTLPNLPAPVLTPAPGIYSSIQNVTITDTLPGATLYYEINGTLPYLGSPVYSSPIPISTTRTVSVYAVAPGYTSVLLSGRYTIARGPAITWPTPAPITYGTALSSTQLNATTTVPGTFTYSPASGTVLTAGSQTITATFTPTNTQAYPVTTATVTLTVNRATPTVTWSAPTAITYGTALSGAQLNASASVPGTFLYAPPSGTVLSVGNQTLSATFTPTDTTNYAPVTATVSLTVNKAATQITWPAPSPIAYGTPLGAAQLNATASVPGTFLYAPPSGTVLSVGNQALAVTFTPTDATDYTTATASVVLPVINPAPVISSLTPAHTAAGGAAFSLTVNGAGFMPTSTVFWGGTALPTQFVSAAQLTASVPGSAIATSGTAAVTVQTGTPGGGSSGALQFAVDSGSSQGAAPPTFTTVTASVNAGSPATYAVSFPSSVISSTVSCLNLPAGATCSYANGTLTIATASNTPTGTYVVTVVFTETLTGAASAFCLPFLLLPLAIRRRRSRAANRLLVACAALTLLAGGLIFTGCGGASSGSGGGTTQPVTHQATTSATVTLVVH